MVAEPRKGALNRAQSMIAGEKEDIEGPRGGGLASKKKKTTRGGEIL